MRKAFLHRHKGRLLATLFAVLLPVGAANAWWGGYAPGWGCDPQWAYLEEYGFLDPFGPSPTDWQRLNRDQLWAARSAYYGDYLFHDPVAKAVRRQCHGWRRPYYYW